MDAAFLFRYLIHLKAKPGNLAKCLCPMWDGRNTCIERVWLIKYLHGYDAARTARIH